MDEQAGGTRRKHRLALVVAPHLFADALAFVLAADDVDEVIDLTANEAIGIEDTTAHALALYEHYDTAVVSPGAEPPDADVVIVLPPSGFGEVMIAREGTTEHVEVGSVAALFDLLDVYSPAPQRRRRPVS